MAKLGAALRHSVWILYNGDQKAQEKCYCCGLETVSVGSFESGHVIARNKGGPNTLQNLRPICSKCNTSMGVKNMREFAVENGLLGRIVDELMTISEPPKPKDESERKTDMMVRAAQLERAQQNELALMMASMKVTQDKVQCKGCLKMYAESTLKKKAGFCSRCFDIAFVLRANNGGVCCPTCNGKGWV